MISLLIFIGRLVQTYLFVCLFVLLFGQPRLMRLRVFICSPEWSSHFYPRNLVAMTAEPLLLYPTHYVGDQGYFSDTETTGLIPPDLQEVDKLKGIKDRVEL